MSLSLLLHLRLQPILSLVDFVSSEFIQDQLNAGSYVYNMRTGKKERISRLMQMHSNKQNPIDKVDAGDICAGVGFKDIKTGDTLVDEKTQDCSGIYVFP